MIDWDTIKKCFGDLQVSLFEFSRAATSDELEAHYVYAQLGKPSPLNSRLELGALSYQGSPTYKERLDDIAALVAGEHLRVVSPTLSISFRDLLFLLEEKIEARQADTQFLVAWGTAYELSGRVAELMLLQEKEEIGFHRNTKAGTAKGTIAQQYWHAHWVQAHQDMPRAAAEDELAEICRLIRQGRREAPKGFLPDWFSMMVCQEDGAKLEPGKRYDQLMLKTPYRLVALTPPCAAP